MNVTPVIPPQVALPPHARAIAYQVYAALGVLVSATQTGYLAGGFGQPLWLTIAVAVYAALGVGLGLTAASNTDVTPPLYQAQGAHYADSNGDGHPDTTSA